MYTVPVSMRHLCFGSPYHCYHRRTSYFYSSIYLSCFRVFHVFLAVHVPVMTSSTTLQRFALSSVAYYHVTCVSVVCRCHMWCHSPCCHIACCLVLSCPSVWCHVVCCRSSRFIVAFFCNLACLVRLGIICFCFLGVVWTIAFIEPRPDLWNFTFCRSAGYLGRWRMVG